MTRPRTARATTRLATGSPQGLAPLAAAIRREHEAAEASWRGAVGHAVRAGEFLIEAKAQLGHGEWLPWLERNCPASARTAQGYMRLAKHAEDAQALAHLGVAGALKELAAPKELPAPEGAAEPPDEFEREIAALHERQRFEAERSKLQYERHCRAKGTEPGEHLAEVVVLTRRITFQHRVIDPFFVERVLVPLAGEEVPLALRAATTRLAALMLEPSPGLRRSRWRRPVAVRRGDRSGARGVLGSG